MTTPTEIVARALCTIAANDPDELVIGPRASDPSSPAWHSYRRDAERLLIALRAAGFAVVPREPTLAMFANIHDHTYDDCDTVSRVYTAMLAAAEEP